MYFYTKNKPEKITSYQLKEQGKALIYLHDLKDLADWFKVDLPWLKKLAQTIPYKQFYIPKRDGKKRLIETPNKKLKRLQKRLAYSLQGAYEMVKPDCVYGFILSTADELETRNIYTNAQQHVQSKWVLGLDLKNFFHAISDRNVQDILRKPPFGFSKNATACLTKLVTFQKRLPMGAPTSPVLSNWYCLEMDHQLLKLSKKYQWTYTRFADDMTFSSQTKIKSTQLDEIQKIIQECGLVLNQEKIRICRTKDEPEITGLLLKEGKPDVSKNLLKNIEKDIALFHELTSMRILERSIFPSKLIYQFRQSIIGQISFVGFVRGKDHKTYWKLKNKLYLNKR